MNENSPAIINEKIICKICEYEAKSRLSLAGHIGSKHKINIEEYFIKYLMIGDRPLCPVCQKETRFNKGTYIFQKYCVEHANEARKEWGKSNSTMEYGWRKGLTKETHEGIKRQSEQMKGENNPFYGKTHSQKFIENLTERNKERRLTEEEKQERLKNRPKRNRTEYHKQYREGRKQQEKIDVKEKVCSVCKELKLIGGFNAKLEEKDGTRSFCKECQSIKWSIYFDENKEEIIEKCKARRQTEESKEYFKEYQRKWQKEKRDNNPVYRFMSNIGRSIRTMLHGAKNCSLKDILPYSPDELKEYIEKKFTLEMNWNNYGSYWELDHIYPQSKLPYLSMNEENFKKCWALENLQPLTISENRSKSDKCDVENNTLSL